MSPRFFAGLWVLYFAAALLCWVTGLMTMFTVVVFGFISFGLVFTGMMCVLPVQVAYEHEKEHPIKVEKPKPVMQKTKAEKQAVPAGALRSV